MGRWREASRATLAMLPPPELRLGLLLPYNQVRALCRECLDALPAAVPRVGWLGWGLPGADADNRAALAPARCGDAMRVVSAIPPGEPGPAFSSGNARAIPAAGAVGEDAEPQRRAVQLPSFSLSRRPRVSCATR